MATHAPITGAPARANVIPFPLSHVADLRRRLRYCRNLRMHDRWTADMQKVRKQLDDSEVLELVSLAAAHRFSLLLAEGC